MLSVRTLLLSIFVLVYAATQAQDNVTISPNYLSAVATESALLQEKIDKKSKKLFSRLQKQEAILKRKLQKIDSTAAQNIFTDCYKNIEQKLSGNTGEYIPKIDSLVSSLNFLEKHPQFLSQSKAVQDKLKAAISKVDGLKTQLAKAENIKAFIKERKEFLKEQLSKFGLGGQLAKELKKINKEVYYYSQQINEYKEILKDSKKAERKALELLSNTKLFKDFMRRHSMLASLFSLPGGDEPSSGATALAGLQTRAQVNSLIQQQLTAAGPNAQAQLAQNIQDAQSQLNELKEKMITAPFGGENKENANTQKTKTFWKRLEYGTNLQTQKSNGWYPTTSDIGLSVGYKLNDKSVIGIGGSYKLGLGQNIRNIRFSHQGMGLRSFVDIKTPFGKGLLSGIWISGGYEMNFRSKELPLTIAEAAGIRQESGLLGLSKKITISSPLGGKRKSSAKLQLFWDFLSYQQLPKTQAVVFRVGWGVN